MTREPADLAAAIVGSLDDPLLAARLAARIKTDEQSSAEWLDATGAAEHLGLTRHALHKLTAARAIPFEQDAPRCKLWFRRTDLDHWRRSGGVRGHTLRTNGTSGTSADGVGARVNGRY
jgi:hypothetical protein